MSVWRTLGNIVKRVWQATGGREDWPEAYVTPGTSLDLIFRRMTFLRQHGVRCYVHQLAPTDARLRVQGMARLRVHPEDLEQAHRLLREVTD